MNIEKLKRLAEAATPGPWDVAYSEIPHRYGGSHKDVVICQSEIDAQLKGRYPIVCQAVGVGDGDHGHAVKFTHINDENAAYIAAANPAAVLSLIVEIERLKDLLIKRDREYRQEMASYRLKVQSQDEATFSAQRDLLRVQKDEIEQLRDQVNGLTGTADRAEKERDELLVALKDAATSLETIHLRSYGEDSHLHTTEGMRAYAGSRASVARDAIAKAEGRS